MIRKLESPSCAAEIYIMLNMYEVPETNLLEFYVEGKIDKEEFDRMIDRVSAAFEKHGKVRVLEHIESLQGIPVSRIWKDITFGLTHLRAIDKAAVVTDKKWIKNYTGFARHFMPFEMRHFPVDQMTEARNWLAEKSPTKH